MPFCECVCVCVPRSKRLDRNDRFSLLVWAPRLPHYASFRLLGVVVVVQFFSSFFHFYLDRLVARYLMRPWRFESDARVCVVQTTGARAAGWPKSARNNERSKKERERESHPDCYLWCVAGVSLSWRQIMIEDEIRREWGGRWWGQEFIYFFFLLLSHSPAPFNCSLLARGSVFHSSL